MAGSFLNLSFVVRLPPFDSADEKNPFDYASSAGCKAPVSWAAQLHFRSLAAYRKTMDLLHAGFKQAIAKLKSPIQKNAHLKAAFLRQPEYHTP